jgi:Domain of unknown function (DUF5668)
LLLDQLHVLNYSLWSLWPVILIASGLDSMIQNRHFVGPLVVIGLGALFLLGNLGYLTVSVWELASRLWPIIIIAVGLDILLGRRSLWSSVVGIVLGLVLLAGILWLSTHPINRNVPANLQPVTIETQQATTANVDIESVQGELIVQGMTDPLHLIQGKVGLGGGESLLQNYSVNGNRGTLLLKPVGNFSSPGFFIYPGSTEGWNLSLNSAVPMDLTLKQVVGEQKADLSNLKINNLTMETVIGQTEVTLPAAGPMRGNINAVIGELTVNVPKNTSLRIKLNAAITSRNYPPDFTRNGNFLYSPTAPNPGYHIDLNIDQPIGSLIIRYAP